MKSDSNQELQGKRNGRGSVAAKLPPFKPPMVYKSSLLAMVAGKMFLWPKYAVIFDNRVVGFAIGVPLFVTGAQVAMFAKKAFQQSNTPMMPTNHKKDDHHHESPLHISGTFAYTRNPMYLGISLGLVGAAFVSNCSWNLLFPLLNAMVMDRCFIPVEEEILEEAYGEVYRTYKTQVRRWL